LVIHFKIYYMQRRNFIKGACRICLLGAAGVAAIDFVSCSPAVGKSMESNILNPVVTNDRIEVPLNIFDTKKLQIISPKKYAYEIAVEKKQDGTYLALLLKCTHYANQLIPTGNGFNCNLHGSKFSEEGKVVKGPAEHPLLQLQTTITDQTLFIQLLKTA